MDEKICETCANWKGSDPNVRPCSQLYLTEVFPGKLCISKAGELGDKHPMTMAGFSCQRYAPKPTDIFRVSDDNQAMQETVIVMDTDIGEEEYTVPMSYGKTQAFLNWLNQVCPYIYRGPR